MGHLFKNKNIFFLGDFDYYLQWSGAFVNVFACFQHFFFLFGEVAQLLVPSPGNEPMTPALGAWSLNHGNTREVPYVCFLHTVTMMTRDHPKRQS